MKRLGILVSGSGSNMEAVAQSCQKGLLSGAAEVGIVVSNRTGVAALTRARRLGLESVVCRNRDYPSRQSHEAAVLELLRENEIDIVALAGYMRILTPFFLKGVPGPVVNMHPVPTYLYQGASGYEFFWENRSRFGAVFPTVHFVDEGVDTGKVILFGLPRDLRGVPSLPELRTAGLAEEHRLFPEALLRVADSEKSGEHSPKTDGDSKSWEHRGVLGVESLLAALQEADDGASKLRIRARWVKKGLEYGVKSGRGGETLAKGTLIGPPRVVFTSLLTLLRDGKGQIELKLGELRIDLPEESA